MRDKVRRDSRKDSFTICTFSVLMAMIQVLPGLPPLRVHRGCHEASVLLPAAWGVTPSSGYTPGHYSDGHLP